jgi:hypothetical protein
VFLHQLDWQRSDQPVLSSLTTAQSWCRTTVYSPTVLKENGRYRMWYLGCFSSTRLGDMHLGYAESDNGIDWVEHPHNPIHCDHELPLEGSRWQTPHVLYDDDMSRYRMWFVMPEGQAADGTLRQRLGHATSADGLAWDIDPEVLYPSARRPCVWRDGPGQYRMWVNSAPDPDGHFRAMAGAIFRFTSTDGLHWERDAEPAVTADGEVAATIVYPFVVEDDGDYTMWYGCHVDDMQRFEIYCSTSSDGLTWTDHRQAPSFPATLSDEDFDGRYTSTPCVVDDGDRWLLYYSARDWGKIYGTEDGRLEVDSMSIYRHIGVAWCAK